MRTRHLFATLLFLLLLSPSPGHVIAGGLPHLSPGITMRGFTPRSIRGLNNLSIHRLSPSQITGLPRGVDASRLRFSGLEKARISGFERLRISGLDKADVAKSGDAGGEDVLRGLDKVELLGVDKLTVSGLDKVTIEGADGMKISVLRNATLHDLASANLEGLDKLEIVGFEKSHIEELKPEDISVSRFADSKLPGADAGELPALEEHLLALEPFTPNRAPRPPPDLAQDREVAYSACILLINRDVLSAKDIVKSGRHLTKATIMKLKEKLAELRFYAGAINETVDAQLKDATVSLSRWVAERLTILGYMLADENSPSGTPPRGLEESSPSVPDKSSSSGVPPRDPDAKLLAQALVHYRDAHGLPPSVEGLIDNELIARLDRLERPPGGPPAPQAAPVSGPSPDSARPVARISPIYLLLMAVLVLLVLVVAGKRLKR